MAGTTPRQSESRIHHGQPTGGPRILSLGAGVQSTAILVLAAEGRIPPFYAAIFADTGWEPQEVYDHLDRIVQDVAEPAGIPVIRVSNGDLKDESLSSDFTTVLPLFVRNPDGSAGILSRQCTQNYKLLPIYRYVRQILGAPETQSECTACQGTGVRIPPGRATVAGSRLGQCSVCRGSGIRVRVGPVPLLSPPVRMAIGFSTDEIQRVAPSRRRYVTHEYPLLDLGWSRHDALSYLADRGFPETPRSACVGCPYHSDNEWQRLRTNHPAEWAEAVAFDAAIRHVPGASSIQGHAFLHRRLLPLAEAIEFGDATSEVQGCSPFGCRSEAGIDVATEDDLIARDESAENHLWLNSSAAAANLATTS